MFGVLNQLSANTAKAHEECAELWEDVLHLYMSPLRSAIEGVMEARITTTYDEGYKDHVEGKHISTIWCELYALTFLSFLYLRLMHVIGYKMKKCACGPLGQRRLGHQFIL